MYEVFRQYDVTREGRLPLKDIPGAMLALGYNPTQEELAHLIQRVNKEGNTRTYKDIGRKVSIM